MGNASEEIGKVVNPRKLGLHKLAPEAGAFQRSDLGKGLEHNFTQIHQGIGEGIKKFGSELDSFVERNTRSLRPPSRPGEEAQTASANYTGQSQTQRSGSGKRGSGKLTSKDRKKKQGKKALTITK